MCRYNSTLIKVFVVGRVKRYGICLLKPSDCMAAQRPIRVCDPDCRMSLQQLNDAAAAALSAGAASERDGSGSAQSSARVAALRTEQVSVCFSCSCSWLIKDESISNRAFLMV